jgi:hypothetical protein
MNVQKQASLNTYLTKRIAAFYGLYVLDAQVMLLHRQFSCVHA